MTSIPGSGLPEFGVSDKFEHFFAYLLLTILGGLTFHYQRKFSLLRKNVYMFSFIIFNIYGLFDELHQKLIPGRFFDLFDLLANLIGVSVGLLLLRLLLVNNDKVN